MTLHQQAVNEISSLSEDQLTSLIMFIKSFKTIGVQGGVNANAKPRQRKCGILKGKFILSEDFNEIPDGFEDYI